MNPGLIRTHFLSDPSLIIPCYISLRADISPDLLQCNRAYFVYGLLFRLSKSHLINVIEVEERSQEGLVKQHIYFIIFICFILLVTCDKQKSQWKGAIEEVDGIKIGIE